MRPSQWRSPCLSPPPSTASPPCAELLGWRVVDARPAEGWIRIGFQARPEFRNPAGAIQGGFLAAMLDDTMGPAVFAHTDGATYVATIDMTVSFLAPAKVGPIYGEGQVVQLGKTVGFVEARLMDEDGVWLAKASSSVRLIPTDRALDVPRSLIATA
ncbi:PaaI family thioesterase [Phenylobacterium sp.]|uniref:PaaI family thioesterase n=1 Tax=Phenylobacterium sp. TaxID=1871053 RepID=UPI0035B280F2